MNKVTVSIAIRHNLVAILFMENGTLKYKVTKKIMDEKVKDSSYSSMIYAFNLALREVRQYISENKDSRDICFEISNSIFIKWVSNQYSKEAYQNEFMKSMRLLQELPIRYAFKYSQKPIAFVYADEKYIKHEKLSSLDLGVVDES